MSWGHSWEGKAGRQPDMQSKVPINCPCFEYMGKPLIFNDDKYWLFFNKVWGKCASNMLGQSDDNDYSPDCLIAKWDEIHHTCIHCPCLDAASRFEKCCIVHSSCLNVILCHSLFILPPSSLHAKANLILGLLIVGAFSQAFFQFTSISSSQCASRLPSQKGKKFLLWGSWFETGWQVSPTTTLTSSPFSPFSFWWAALSQLSGLLQ